ncbi:uncharacterized protein LOC131258221 isoform X2 [Magnolia sinica]|uniref:uncharacterized protein LOC131258221 isoform X2 n=1 Tax=Magnolia sinica TaxID=86752 RepID=UPI00265835C2|nr:uncharacterized protein LOC131258221 isoform X2 [Magnolia sinica]
MQSFDALDAFLVAASRACCSSFAIFIQIQGCVICLTLALGWCCAAYVRSRVIRRIKNNIKCGNSFGFLCQDINDLEHSAQMKLPRVSVVMPLKGFGEHNLQNWRSQITSLYGGPLEFLFVVESTEDPAYHAVSLLIKEYEDSVDAKILIAGLSTTCSQKIHNQLPCSMGFATGGRTFFLWGGCMMMHADDFRNDLYGVVSGLRDGGYSDDMTLAAIAGAHKRLISSPPVAIFPHPLASDLSFPRYWNYLRKQTFVLESYISKVNWMMNRALFSSHCYLSWGFVAPYFMALIHVTAALRARFNNLPFTETGFTCSGLLLAGCLAICTVIELFSMWNLTKVEIQLCNLLSPEGPPVSLGSYNWGLVFLAMLVDNFLYPVSAIRSHFSQSINWSGVRYHLRNGKIRKIERCKENGPNYTDLGGKHLYGKRANPQKTSLLSSFARSLAQWHQPKKFDG